MDAYEAVNHAWPKDIPGLTRVEAGRAAAKLARAFWAPKTAKRYGAKPRRCWIALKPPFGGLNKGWRRLVHDVAHVAYRETHPRTRPHGEAHAELEGLMVAYVLEHGWFDGRLKEKSTWLSPMTKREARREKIRLAIVRWERKRDRAITALLKLRRRERYYLRNVVNAEKALAAHRCCHDLS